MIGQETGGDAVARAKEAKELVDMILPHSEELSPKEQRFIEQTAERLDQYGEKTIISGKQLFWLRDIKDGVL